MLSSANILLALTLFGASATVTAQAEPAFQGELLIETVLSSAKCLTATSNAVNAPVTLTTCSNPPNASQKWTFANGQIKVFGNKCLQVPNGTNQDGVKLQIATCNGSKGTGAQAFEYSVWSNTITWSGTNKCVDLTSGGLGDGTPIQVWTCSNKNPNQFWNVGYSTLALPQTSQKEQTGINNCSGEGGGDEKCQTVWLNSASDFCLWGPPTVNTVGDAERDMVAYCTKKGRGARTIPDGALHGVHFVTTPDYVQVTGVGNFTGLNVRKGDAGGELDNRGADGRGNPIGGLVYGNTFGPSLQYHEWTSFISDTEFCFRACVGPKATSLCNHIYDEMGCFWNMPANYEPNVFEDCQGDDDLPMGVYGTSTWHQGVSPTPSAHPVASSSNCKALPTVSVTNLQRRELNPMFAKRRLNTAAVEEVPAWPGQTPAPRV
ncbi:hypothetical protein D9613_008118 [Agrocybe pediades]|uniref:Ricin B lectin domain-containing protein n=1 Tax=Agrocybe pediades TaxID=84607 RepID=A0A8H4QMK9_9AGAR|nr:hypothetical protein D9613_008118 [Agrocybe pediades]